VRVGKGADGLKIGVLWAMRKIWALQEADREAEAEGTGEARGQGSAGKEYKAVR
jgi:hypothetical protein